jgi:small subunit ribosomal protein S15
MLVKKDYYLHEKDTGSTALQIISLREKINKLKIHLKENKKNVPAIRALLKNVA